MYKKHIIMKNILLPFLLFEKEQLGRKVFDRRFWMRNYGIFIVLKQHNYGLTPLFRITKRLISPFAWNWKRRKWITKRITQKPRKPHLNKTNFQFFFFFRPSEQREKRALFWRHKGGENTSNAQRCIFESLCLRTMLLIPSVH